MESVHYLRYRVNRALGPRFWRAVHKMTNRSPYRDFNDKYSAIFIHVPKAAGTSVAEALFGAQPGHTTADYFRYFDEERFNAYFTFTFVRNPWDRLVSSYFYLKQRKGTSIDRFVADRYFGDVGSFAEFVRLLHGQPPSSPLRDWLHFLPQTEFVCDRDGNLLVDFVGRFERLHDDFSHICERLRIEASLGDSNRSRHVHYAEYYDDETADMVAEIYRSDVEILNYAFCERTGRVPEDLGVDSGAR